MSKFYKQAIYSIVGPTASGKTEIGVELALKIGGEIINCDSVQIYKEIQIATKQVKDKPELSIAIAGIFGLLIGLLIGRKKIGER